MKILCDIDGVVCSYDFPAITKEFFGKAVSNEDIYAYSIEDVLGVSRQSVNHMFLEACQRRPVMIDGARRVLREFILHGMEVYIYTNRLNFMTVGGLASWLKKCLIPCTGIAILESNRLTETFDFHIDDSPAKLMDLNGKVRRKLLFDQPWNRRCMNITGKMERVYSWEEVRGIIKEEFDRELREASTPALPARTSEVQPVDNPRDEPALDEKPRLRRARRPPWEFQEGSDDSGALPTPQPV